MAEVGWRSYNSEEDQQPKLYAGGNIQVIQVQKSYQIRNIVGRQIPSTVNNNRGCNRNRSNLSALICVASALICGKKKRISRTADDKGLTLIHADKENRYLNNSEPNKFDIISQNSLVDKIAFPYQQSGKASAFICVYLRFPSQSKKSAISLVMTNN